MKWKGTWYQNNNPSDCYQSPGPPIVCQIPSILGQSSKQNDHNAVHIKKYACGTLGF